MSRPKKFGNPFAEFHHYLNYGLLGLASILGEKGYQPKVVHGKVSDPTDFVDSLHVKGLLETEFSILLSVPSSYAITWARDACCRIKQINRDASIIIGGRWVMADDESWIKQKIPDADFVKFGTAEHCIENLVQKRNLANIAGPPTSDIIPRLDYTLLTNHQDFTPSFEVSRGCGRGCSFCAEAFVPLSNMKSVPILADEIENCLSTYRDPELRGYFETSFFRPPTAWIDQLADEFKLRGIKMKWRTESRVDSLSASQISKLAACGLKILDLGLESASPIQLLQMQKTKKPESYLQRAAALLKACHDNGIWPKVNILLYPGETAQTISETQDFLDKHRKYIKGVSAGPMILYRYGKSSSFFLEELKALGAAPVDKDSLEKFGFSDMHLSSEISNQVALSTCRDIAKEFMTARDYFDLKSFNYFPRTMTFDEFLCQARSSNINDLAFSL